MCCRLRAARILSRKQNSHTSRFPCQAKFNKTSHKVKFKQSHKSANSTYKSLYNHTTSTPQLTVHSPLPTARNAKNSARMKEIQNALTEALEEHGINDAPRIKRNFVRLCYLDDVRSNDDDEEGSSKKTTNGSIDGILKCIETISKKTSSKRSKNSASVDFLKSVFSSLGTALAVIIEQEEYLPFETDDTNNEEDEDSANQEELEEDIAEALCFMKACAQILNAYLRGLCPDIISASAATSKTKAKARSKVAASSSAAASSSSNSTTKDVEVTVLDEALEIAELLHESLFNLSSVYNANTVAHNNDDGASCECRTTDPNNSKNKSQEKYLSEAELHKIGLETKSSISQLCQTWWLHNFYGRDLLVTQLVPLLLVKSLDGGAVQRDVQNMYDMRHALTFFDFDDDASISYLRSLLLRTASSPLYLRHYTGKNATNNLGRKFIVYLFQLHESLVRDLHRAVRVQIPDAKMGVLQAYGDVYFQAWKSSVHSKFSMDHQEARLLYDDDDDKDDDKDDDNDSEDEDGNRRTNLYANVVEEHVLQDLLYASLHLAQSSMAASVRTVLQPFFRAKKTPEVDQMLYRMYSPILWRALKAVNPLVRVNACVILADTFPLRDPSAGPIQTEECLVNSVTIIKSLLLDEDPRVRVASADATARILGSYWDALSSADIRGILNSIITKLASDKSSALVRAAAISSVTLMLEAPQTHAVLRALLPSLGNLIHDTSEKVRLGMVRMLLRIKKLKGIKFYHVVPVEHLLVRLAAEGQGSSNPTGSVASALTNLMQNSYFPQGEGVTGSEQVRRTLAFLASHPLASEVFYTNLSSHLSINSVSKLAAMLLKCLSASVEAEKKEMEIERLKKKKARRGSKKRKSSSNSRKKRKDASLDNGSDEEEEGRPSSDDDEDDRDDLSAKTKLIASNTALMASIAETICCLWESIGDSISERQNKACYEFLMDAFSGAVLTDVHAHFDEKASECEDDASEEETKIKVDCHRVCASLLRCAGRMPINAVVGLSNHLTTKMKNISDDDDDVCGNATNLAPHIALLCLWGKTDQVAVSLANSISKVFGKCNIFGDESEPLMVDDSERHTRKRRQGGEAAVPTIPCLPAAIAMRVIGNILSGPDPSCVAARESILHSDVACNAIFKSLEGAHRAAEKLLGINEINKHLFATSEIELILTACESYGRLALHKQAATANGDMHLNDQAKTMMMWITNRIIPAFEKGRQEAAPGIAELDISRISTVRTSTLSMAPPGPIFSPPDSESSRPSGSNIAGSNEKRHSITFLSDDDVQEASVYAKASAISLVSSATIIFSEWLAVGGLGGNDIAFHATKWSDMLSLSANDAQDDENLPLARDGLLPAFCRLTVQLVKCRSNVDKLLQSMLKSCDDIEEGGPEQSIIKKSVVAMLNIQAQQSGGDDAASNGIVPAILELSRLCALVDDNEDVPETVVDLFDDKACNLAVRTAFSAACTNNFGCFALVNCVSHHISKFVAEHNESADLDGKGSIAFDLKCLIVVSSSTALSKGVNGRKIKGAMQDLRKKIKDYARTIVSRNDDGEMEAPLPFLADVLSNMKIAIST